MIRVAGEKGSASFATMSFGFVTPVNHSYEGSSGSKVFGSLIFLFGVEAEFERVAVQFVNRADDDSFEFAHGEGAIHGFGLLGGIDLNRRLIRFVLIFDGHLPIFDREAESLVVGDLFK